MQSGKTPKQSEKIPKRSGGLGFQDKSINEWCLMLYLFLGVQTLFYRQTCSLSYCHNLVNWQRIFGRTGFILAAGMDTYFTCRRSKAICPLCTQVSLCPRCRMRIACFVIGFYPTMYVQRNLSRRSLYQQLRVTRKKPKKISEEATRTAVYGTRYLAIGSGLSELTMQSRFCWGEKCQPRTRSSTLALAFCLKLSGIP